MPPAPPLLNFPRFSHLRLAVTCDTSVLSSRKRAYIRRSAASPHWHSGSLETAGQVFLASSDPAGLTQVVTYGPVQCPPGSSLLFSLLGLS